MKTLQNWKMFNESIKPGWEDWEEWQNLSNDEKKEIFDSLEPIRNADLGKMLKELNVANVDFNFDFGLKSLSEERFKDYTDINIEINNQIKISINSAGVYKSSNQHGIDYEVITEPDMGDSEPQIQESYSSTFSNMSTVIDILKKYKSIMDQITIEWEDDDDYEDFDSFDAWDEYIRNKNMGKYKI